MPDLGKYAFEVGLAYGVSLAIVAALIVWVAMRSVQVKKRLRDVEARLSETRQSQ